MKRKILSLFTAIIMLFPILSIPGNATNTVSYDTAYQWAVNAGFPKTFLDNIDENFLDEIYYANVNDEKLEVGYKVAHLTPSGMTTNGNISSSDLTYTIVYGKVSSGGIIQNVNIYVSYKWSPYAMVTYTDAVAINWDSSVWYMDDNSFSAYLYGDTDNYCYDTLTRPATKNQGGCGWFLPLSSQRGYPYGHATFELKPINTSLRDGTAYASSVTGIYAHRTLALPLLSFSTSGFSVGISGVYNQAAASTSFLHG